MSNSLLGVVVGGYLHGKMFKTNPLYPILLVAIKTSIFLFAYK
jgi:F0F1-type ATP synthase assembly protein I